MWSGVWTGKVWPRLGWLVIVRRGIAMEAAAVRSDQVAAIVSAGGRPDLAEAGGKDAAALDAALDGVYSVVESLLGT